MDNLSFLLQDPIIWISATGLTTVLAICSYYIYFFVKHINESEQS